MGALLRYLWRQHRAVLSPMAGALMLFEFLLTRIAPAPSEVSWMSGLLAIVPPQLLALAGSEPGALSPAGFLSIGYGHPFFLLVLGAWTVRVTSAAVAGEIGRGTMDLLASRPITRTQQVAASYAALGAGLIVLTGAAWTGTAIGLAVRDIGVHARTFVPVAAMAWLLFATFGGIGLIVTVLRRDAGSAIAWTAGFIAAEFVLEYLARLWKPIAPLGAVSLFAYYRPQALVSGGSAARETLTLAFVAMVTVAVAIAAFRRRDL